MLNLSKLYDAINNEMGFSPFFSIHVCLCLCVCGKISVLYNL